MLLGAAERRIGIAATLAGLIADPRDPALVTHSVADISKGHDEEIPSWKPSKLQGRAKVGA